MEILVALLALGVGAALGWFIAQSRSAASAERARLAGDQLAWPRAMESSLRAA